VLQCVAHADVRVSSFQDRVRVRAHACAYAGILSMHMSFSALDLLMSSPQDRDVMHTVWAPAMSAVVLLPCLLDARVRARGRGYESFISVI